MKPEELQRLYSESGGDGDCGTDSHDVSPRARRVAKLMAEYREPRKVLDVGCADGSLLKDFTKLHAISGVDISEKLIARATRNGYQHVQMLDASTQPLPYPDKTFDVVVCGECIEHVVDTDWLLCEINRVLKPGGHLILTFPNIRTPIGFIMLLFNLPPMYSARYRSAHVRDFTTGTVRLALGNSGFRPELMWGSGFYIHKVGHCLSGLAKFLPSWASGVVARATKHRDAAYSEKAVAQHEIFKSDD